MTRKRREWSLDEFKVAEAPGLDRFHDFGLPLPLMRGIARLGFEYCTPIQSEALPYALSDYDIVGQAQTGTGKTAAFLIALITHQLENPLPAPREPGFPRSLILAPTRELAMQIADDAVEIARYCSTRVVSVIGGMDFERQRLRLAEDAIDILVATPGRLIDFSRRRHVDLSRVESLVIDEADRLMDMGFIPDVRRIVLMTPHKKARQTLFFSATYNDDVKRIAESWTREAIHIQVKPEQIAAESIDQQFWMVGRKDKLSVLKALLDTVGGTRVLVFVNRRDQGARVAEGLKRLGANCQLLTGDVPQKKRLKVLSRFRDGESPTLVATDVAGRGLHVEAISHVVNFDLPYEADDYVHRIGRTGRAGAEGKAVSFVCEDDAFSLPAIEEVLGSAANCVHPPESLLETLK